MVDEDQGPAQAEASADEHRTDEAPGSAEHVAGEGPAEEAPAQDAADEGAPDEGEPAEDPVRDPGSDGSPADTDGEDPPAAEEPDAGVPQAEQAGDDQADDQPYEDGLAATDPVPDQGADQPGTEAGAPAAASRPRRARRAASRPAGPPPEHPAGEPGSQPLPGDDAVSTEGTATQESATDAGPATEPAAERSAERDEAAAPQRRSRRATRPMTTIAFSSQPDPIAPAVAPEASPVVTLFQPPDEAVVRRRRAAERPERPAEPVEPPADDLEVEDEDATEEPVDDIEADDEETPRRRRRRGGRRRRRSGGSSSDDEAGADGESAQDGQAPARVAGDEEPDEGEPASSEEPDDESPSARRRRRRRRRAGVSEEMEDLSTDDPPNTVVKVRDGRRPTDEITSVRGSTRIEAKKQRRRDGRDAGRRRVPILTEAEFLARRESVNRVMCVREHGDRTQIAVLEDGVLVEHYVNRADSSSMVGNVYLGRVQNVLPSMEAAFVDIGRGRNAVLYAGEVNWDAAGMEGQPKRIELALKSGDSVLVQVTKDPIGHKGARLTSQISLPGRFLVYVPEGSMTGISRKLPDTERARLKGILKDVVPEGAGVIVRTAAEGATEEQLTADVTRLTAQWTDITKKAKSASAPSLLYGEPDLAIKVVRDIFNEDFTSLVVQGDGTWQTLTDYIGWVAPDLSAKLQHWVEPTDLYAANRIDEQLAKALDRKVWLPSGGSLVIDRTEAMTVVDVNTGRFTGQGGNLEETVTRNNLEAAEEIVRQLRLRDIGGIIVVDFIDMVLESNRDLVLRRLVECLGRDRTKHQVAEVTSLGLVQMTRKRIGQGLLEVFSVPCEACNGRGHTIQSEPVGTEPSGDDRRPEQARSRRGGRQSAAPLGGKQTGRTPPPPRIDEHGHVEVHETDHAEVGLDAGHPDPSPAQPAASGSPEHEGHAPDLDVPQDQPVAVVHEGRDIVEPGPGPDDEPHHEEARDAV